VPALVELQSEHGAVLFEGEFSEAALEQIAADDKIGDQIKKTGTSLSALSGTIRESTQGLLDVFDDLGKDERGGGSFSTAVIELGVKVTAEGNIVVAKGTVEANVTVTLTWDFS
jgi:hypothetical protein